MRIMTICATNPTLIHLALKKRSIHIDFITNLSVWIIEVRIQEGRHIVIKKRLSGNIPFCKDAPSGVTFGTGVDLLGCSSQSTSPFWGVIGVRAVCPWLDVLGPADMG